MTRSVAVPIGTPRGTPREGLRVDFHAVPPAESTFAVTDAGGVFVAHLVPGATYMVPTYNAATVNGVAYPAGTMFRVIVPEGEGPVGIDEIVVEVIDASLPALFARIAALEAL